MYYWAISIYSIRAVCASSLFGVIRQCTHTHTDCACASAAWPAGYGGDD